MLVYDANFGINSIKKKAGFGCVFGEMNMDRYLENKVHALTEFLA